MVPASGPPSEGDDQRVRCLYCGANNFARSATCWQCARSLVALREPGPAGAQIANRSEGSQTRAIMGDRTPLGQVPRGQIPPGARPKGFAGLGAAAANAAASAARAPKAAAMLGLLFPWIGLPVGIIFLMLDDDRRAYIGWITIGYSLAGLAINIILGIVLMVPLMDGLKSLIPTGPLHAPGGSQGPSLPDLGGGDSLNLISMLAHILPLPR